VCAHTTRRRIREPTTLEWLVSPSRKDSRATTLIGYVSLLPLGGYASLRSWAYYPLRGFVSLLPLGGLRKPTTLERVG